jgi:hypothetical protein
MSALPKALWVPGIMPTINDLIDQKARGFTKANGKRIDGFADAKKEWTHKIGWLALQQGFAPLPLALAITFVHYHPDKRRDKDGAEFVASKMSLDALVKMKVMRNDGWAAIDDTRHHHTVGTPAGARECGVVLIFDANVWERPRALALRIAP